MKKIILLIFVLFTFLFAENSKVEVYGTSTLHDWKMVSENIVVKMENENNKIKSLKVSMAIETLKSNDSGLDNNAYKAVYDTGNVKKNESVVFTLIKHNEDGSFDGEFSIGENKKSVNIIPESIENGFIKGTLKTKMSSFGIKPPTFLFGMMSTGDELEIKYYISK